MPEKSKNDGLRIALPEKKYFPLDEIAERWSQLSDTKIDTVRLMQLGMEGELIMCVLADAWLVDKSPPPTRDPLDGLVELYPQTIKDLTFKESVEVNWIKSCQGHSQCDIGTLSHQRSSSLSGQKLWKDDEGSPDLFLPLIHRKDLLISRAELNRYEQENTVQESAFAVDALKQNSEETENQRLKRTLAALVLGLAQQSKYKTGDKPNISQLVELAQEGVTDKNGLIKYGYGKNTLKNAIDAALKFAKTELE
ncbi:MAG TPA: hypothetical protein VMV35_03365 [Halothiobacillus sp.]|nr:hypothetical protein [Halothiobacillus sp.]